MPAWEASAPALDRPERLVVAAPLVVVFFAAFLAVPAVPRSTFFTTEIPRPLPPAHSWRLPKNCRVHIRLQD